MSMMNGRTAPQMNTSSSMRQMLMAAALCLAASTGAQAGEFDTTARVNDTVITRQQIGRAHV